MIKVYRLIKRHLDGAKCNDAKLEQIKIFSTCIGHGVGTIDFSEKVLEIELSSFEEILKNGDEYLRFKLGNLSKYFEIEIFPKYYLETCYSLLKSLFGLFLPLLYLVVFYYY